MGWVRWSQTRGRGGIQTDPHTAQLGRWVRWSQTRGRGGIQTDPHTTHPGRWVRWSQTRGRGGIQTDPYATQLGRWVTRRHPVFAEPSRLLARLFSLVRRTSCVTHAYRSYQDITSNDVITQNLLSLLVSPTCQRACRFVRAMRDDFCGSIKVSDTDKPQH